MKIFNCKKNEKGAITVLTAIMLSVLVGFTALSIDVGFHYYRGAKLQNAVDAAATAIGANLGATDSTTEEIAYEYLRKNGYDIDGDYKDCMTLNIEKKGVLNELTVTDQDDYISTGYYKITVEIDDKTSFASVLDLDSLHLKKTAYAKCRANYVEMPDALKYTVFAGSSKGTKHNAALNVNGRTGATVNEITASFEDIINKTNSTIVQPVVGIFGGNPDYNSLVHINLSEAITNGDVHSNSNISIGVQALNTSRVKDYDFNGEESNEEASEEITEDKDNSPEDYGQVTYTAVTDIDFNSSLKNSRDSSTHIYAQNQQFLEQTKAALNIIDTIDDFGRITSTVSLRSEYEAAAREYLAEKTNITENQKSSIIAQKDNLYYQEDGTYLLDNQAMIVYGVSQKRAENMLANARELGLDGLVEQVNNAKTDSVFKPNSNSLLYENIADKSNSFEYGVLFTKHDSEGTVTTKKELVVRGTQVNRDTINIYNGVQGASMNSSTQAGTQFAVARTFRQNSDYITVPNMKPYFVRQINQSVRQATKTSQEISDPKATGDRSVKEAIRNMGKELVAFLKTENFTDDKYSESDKLSAEATSPLFTNHKASKESGLKALTGENHTSYKGYDLYNSEHILKTPEDFINEFRVSLFAPDENEEADYGVGAVTRFYNNKIANSDPSTNGKYDTVYSKDAVKMKKQSLEKRFDKSYDDKKSEVNSSPLLNEEDIPELPNRKDVFLGPDLSDFSSLGITSGTAYTVREDFNRKVKFNTFDSITNLVKTSEADSKEYVKINAPASWADGTTETKIISTKGSGGDENLAGKYFSSSSEIKNKSARVYAQTSNDAISLVKGNLSVLKNWVSKYGNLDIGNSGDQVGAPATLVVTGDVSVDNDIQVRANSVLICQGNISCTNLIVENGGRIYCSGLVASNKINLGNNAVVMCSETFEFKGSEYYSASATSSVTAKTINFTSSNTKNITISGALQSSQNMTFNPRIYLNTDGVIRCLGDITFNGDKDYYSLTNYGKIYVSGNLNAVFKVYTLNGEIYVCGNFMAANSNNTNKNSYNIIEINGTDKIYVGGSMGTNSSAERHIYLYDGTGAVLSVYGYNRNESSSARNPFINVKEFCNTQRNSTVYIGDGKLISSLLSTNATASFTKPFVNNGTLYCYSYFNVSNNADLDGSGVSVFDKDAVFSNGTLNIRSNHTAVFHNEFSAQNLSVDNNSIAVFKKSITVSGNVNVSNNSRINVNNTSNISGELAVNASSSFVCKDGLNCNSAKIHNASKLWCIGDFQSSGLELESSSDNHSEFYCGSSTKIQRDAALVINGDFYSKAQILDNQNIYVLSRLEIKQYGYFICPEDINISNSITVQSGGTLFADGKVTLAGGATVNNYGAMYLMNGLYISENTSAVNTGELNLGYGADTFIGENKDSGGVLTLNGYYFGGGNAYIDNSILIKGYNKSSNDDKTYVYNRGEAIVISSGNTYVSGDINCSAGGNGIYIEQNSSLSCKNLTVSSAIYNSGGLVVLNDLTYINGDYFSDKGDSKLEQGYCILNGGKSKISNAFIYIGGTKQITLSGLVENWGNIFTNASLKVNGYSIVPERMYFGTRPTRKDGDQTDYAPHFSIINGDNAVMQTSGSISTAAGIYNYRNSTIAAQGDIKYGMAILNGGNFVAGGSVGYSDNCYHINHIEVFGSDASAAVGADKKGSFSIVNGFINNASDNQYNKNALFFAGSGVTIGTKEHYSSSETDKVGGTFQNWGTAYFDGSLNLFSNKEYAYNISSIIAQAGSNTFIKDNCFSSSVTAVMDNSIFMCGGNYHSKRATKVNIDEEFLDNNDMFTPCYVYVGGNMLINTSGLSSDSSTNTNTTRKFDVYSNSNVYVGGSLFANCEINLKQNVNLLVAGKKTLNDNNSMSDIIDSIENGTVRQTIRNLIDGTDYKLFGYQHLVIEPCSGLVVNGSAYIRDTSKIRDMTKTYIYGDFKCSDYVEIGKALDGDDETEAKEDLYKAEGENDKDYVFSNAASMFVGGDFYASGYNKIYASSALKVSGDYVTNGYLTLRHDAKIIVGKKVKAQASIDIGSYSTAFIGGSMQASTSTIKIRDCTNVFVGGNMTAFSYVELGKAEDFVREYVPKVTEGEDNVYDDSHEKTHNTAVCPECSTKVNYNNATVTYIKCDNEDCSKYIKAIVQCAHCGENNYYAGENFSCQNCGAADYYNALTSIICDECSTENLLLSDAEAKTYKPFYIKCANAQCGITFNPNAQNNPSDTPSTPGSDGNTEDTTAELSEDSTDKAKGGYFYIGKKLVSYTGYIKEFAYSRVVVGEYVFTPKYVTLRHNADLWIMPETFNNSTYQKKVYVSTSDGTVLGDIIDAIKRFNFEVSQTFSPKAGSLYTLGELTLNKNASLMGTYDCVILGQCVLRQDSLVYMGHDFNCSAHSANISIDSIKGNTSVVGFDTFGTVGENGTAFPVVVYADNSINISTTVSMKLTYLVANKGDVNLYDIYSRSENAENNAKQLPNSVCSYQSDVNYFSMYGKIGALFYAPNGNIDLDGYYMEIWGSCIGDTVDMNTYYIALHRFTNWRTMDLHIAESGNVYLVSENEYKIAEDNVDDIYMSSDYKNNNPSLPDGAQIFF